MAYLQIQTNVDIAADQQQQLLAAASQLASQLVGKPESYVMVALQPKTPMSFGTDAPTAFLSLKSVRLPTNRTSEYSSKLSTLIEQRLQIPKERVYIEFSSPDGSLWGWRGGVLS